MGSEAKKWSSFLRGIGGRDIDEGIEYQDEGHPLILDNVFIFGVIFIF